MVIWGMVYYCFTHIKISKLPIYSKFDDEQPGVSVGTMMKYGLLNIGVMDLGVVRRSGTREAAVGSQS